MPQPPPRALGYTSTASRKFLGSLGTSRRPFVGPVKGPIGSAVVVGNKGQDALAQLRDGNPTGASQQAAHQNAEPDLNLVEPETVFGSVDEANAMAGVGEKGGARAHAGEMTAFAFDTELLLDPTLRRRQAHQGFGLMGVELISDKDPVGFRIGLDGLGDMRGEIGFGTRGSDAGSHNLSGGHVQIGDQTLGAMPTVFKFLSFHMTGLHGQGRVETLEGLNAGHLIRTRHMRACCSERRSGLIHLTHRADLFGQFGGVAGGWGEPIPFQMRLQSARLLKNAPRCEGKSVSRCRV